MAGLSLSRIEEAVSFLRSKGVLEGDDFAEGKFALLLNPATAKNTAYYQACQVRLLRLYDAIMVDHEPRADNPPDGAHLFSEVEFPGYGPVRSPKTSVQRWQKSRLCYTHACTVVQHDNIVHSRQAVGDSIEDVCVLDVALFMAQHFTPAQLAAHVFEDSGGSSKRFLASILEPGSVISASSLENVEGNLKKFGSALVSGFEVSPDFRDEYVHRHAGLPGGTSVGLHAMVLIGARSDASGQRFFLLQNW